MNKYRVSGKVLVASLMTMMIFTTGCTSFGNNDQNTRIVLTTGFGKNEIFRIEKASCSLAEANVYLMNIKNQYENIFGDQLWETSFQGMTLEDNMKDTVLARLAKIKALNLLAQERQVELEQKELEQISLAAQEYFGSLSEAEVKALDVNLESIEKMYQEYALAQKIYEYLIADINPEISDDEARTITVEQILIKTVTIDESGEKVQLSNMARQEANERVQDAMKALEEGESFETVASLYSDEPLISLSFSRGECDEAFEQVAFNLGSGEISDIMEGEDGYYIIKCISTFDREETDRNKIKIVEERRKEVFNEEYSEFVKGLTKNMNEELWDSVGFLDDESITTSTFFDIYEKYINRLLIISTQQD